MLLLTLLLHIFCIVPSQAFVAVTRAECTALDLKFCYFKHCEMRTDAKGQTFLHFHIIVKDKRPNNDVPVNLSLFKVTKTYRIPIFNETIDYCAFRRESVLTKMFSYLTQHFDKFTNANHSCPYQHDIIFYGVDNERFLSEIPAPKGNYILHMRVASDRKWRALVKFYAIQNK